MAIDVLDAAGATETLKTTDSGTEHTPHHNVDSVPAPLSTTGGGTEATALRVTLASDSTGVVSVDDNGASLTVDNAALSVVGGGVEATALRVTLASDSTGVLSVDDGGGSLTVDNSGLTTLAAAVYTDDTSTHATGTTTGGLMMAAATPTDGSVDANDIGAVAMSTDRRLHVDSQIVGQDADLTIADGGNSITVDNAALSVTGGGVEATALRVTIANDSTGVVSVDDNGSSLTVDNAALSVVGGGVEATALRVTLASDSTGVLSVDDNGGSLTVDAAELTTIASPVATISATPLQRVAIFDASDAQITSFGGGTQYTEDAAAASDPVGTATILVRSDTPAGVTSTDGDNIAQRGTNYGAAFVQVVDSGGNLIDTFGGSGGTAAADDADFTAGTTSGTLVQGVYESSPTSVTDGDMGAIGITQTRQVRTSTAQEGTWTVDLGATDNAVLDAIDSNTDYGAVVGGGVEATALRVTIASDSTGVLSVDDNGGSLTVDSADLTTLAGAVSGSEMQVDVVGALPAGTNAIGKLAANSGVDIGDVDVTSVAAPTSWSAERATVTTAGTSVQLATHTCTQGVFIKALSTNTGIVYIHDTSGDHRTDGYELGIGEQIFLAVSNSNLVYVDAATSGDKVQYAVN